MDADSGQWPMANVHRTLYMTHTVRMSVSVNEMERESKYTYLFICIHTQTHTMIWLLSVCASLQRDGKTPIQLNHHLSSK